MRKLTWIAAASMAVGLAIVLASYIARTASADYSESSASAALEYFDPATTENGFSVDVLIDGRLATEYSARGRRYIEALQNAEYELRIHNPTGSRVAVALSVDGMNTIDARHTSAWDAHKWVIEPYGTINVRGWQMSSDNARRFYFTTERDSYGAKIGQTENLGLISAVFFHERKPFHILPVTPGQSRNNRDEDDRMRDEKAPTESTESAGTSAPSNAAKERSARAYPPPDDESAATGIGRTINNGVRWVTMDLDPRPIGDVTIRYEYRDALVRLGIIPRDYPPRPDVLNRRERAEGFEPKYCPQP